MSVLTDKEIAKLATEENLIWPFVKLHLQGASYDMRLGSLMVVEGVPQSVPLSTGSLTLEPGQFAVLTTQERLELPLTLIGHNGIMSYWARRGLVSLFSPQIDPGFKGVLEVPVFNAGDAAVVLIPGKPIFTVEFVRTSKPASFSWAERHGEKNPPTEPLPPKATRPSLQDIVGIATRLEEIATTVSEHRAEVATGVAQSHATMTELDKGLVALKARVDGQAQGQAIRLSRRQAFWGAAAVVVALAIAGGGYYVGNRGDSHGPPAISTGTTPSTVTTAP